MRRIVCVGNGVLDQVFEVDQLPKGGIKATARGFRESGGGPAATAALAIARFGGKASWWGRVGDDNAGRFLLAFLKDNGVDLSAVALLPGARTTRAIVIVDAVGERCILVDRTLPNDPSVLPEDMLADDPVVLVDSRWPEASEIVLERARERGLPRVLDADGGSVEMLERLASRADHIVFSQEGLRDLAGDGEPTAQLACVAQRFGGVVAVTCGSAGSLWRIDGETAHLPAVPVAVRDKTGCGDVFHRAYALGLAEGKAPLEAARLAAATAAAKAANRMGWSGMPNRASVDRLMSHSQEMQR